MRSQRIGTRPKAPKRHKRPHRWIQGPTRTPSPLQGGRQHPRKRRRQLQPVARRQAIELRNNRPRIPIAHLRDHAIQHRLHQPPDILQRQKIRIRQPQRPTRPHRLTRQPMNARILRLMHRNSSGGSNSNSSSTTPTPHRKIARRHSPRSHGRQLRQSPHTGIKANQWQRRRARRTGHFDETVEPKREETQIPKTGIEIPASSTGTPVFGIRYPDSGLQTPPTQ